MGKAARLPPDDCPAAAPAQVTVYTKVLHRACEIAGSVEKLAARLRVPAATLCRWLEGEAEPPTPIFLRAVDLVMPTWTPEDEMLARAIVAMRSKKPVE
jgi:hypothetical protein